MRNELRYLWRWLTCSLKSRARLIRDYRAALDDIRELDRALVIAGEMMRDDAKEIFRLNCAVSCLRRRGHATSKN